MVDPIEKIKGMTPELAVKFRAEGIETADELLAHARTPHQRTELSHKVGTTPVAIKELANRADLMRLKGVGGDLSNLLEEAGVNSCKELQHRLAEHLHQTLANLNASKHIAHHVPPVAWIQDWITEAKTLALTAPEE
jgi:predicted flap endonuclease-1-like 5' DNA nuclease